MSNLRTILTRLVQENLHGPIGPKSDPATKQKEQGPLSQGKVAEPTQGEEPEEDLDAHDPRWRQLFQEFFLSEHSDDRNDDLLFFVQRTTQLEIENGMEPVFVKRKVHGISTPASSEGTPSRHGSRSRRVTSVSWQQLLTVEQERNVLWKDTFFLNVIVQLPCKLTVAVYNRVTETHPVTGATKVSMTPTRKQITKRVYALPTKSRVDVKEATVECSWPLIYYVIDDYEDTFEQLMLRENEHLCVELAVTLPSSNTSTTAVSTISKSRSGIAQQLHQQDTHGNHETGSHRRLSVGSQSRSANKITLFQGMVGYTNLLGIYQQKASSKVGRRFKFGPHTVPTEFIVMRGPGGRGHAQVAITASNIGAEDFSSPESTPSSPINGKAPSWTEKTLPPIPGTNHYGTLNSRNGHSAHRDPEKFGIYTAPLPAPPPSASPPQPSSPSSPRVSTSPPKTFSAGTFFQSLRRISMATLAQAATTATGQNPFENSTPQNQSAQSSSFGPGHPTDQLSTSPGKHRPPSSTTSSNRPGSGAIQEGTRQEIEALVKQPQSLKCCMTFVNIPYTGIGGLLMDYAYQQRSLKD